MIDIASGEVLAAKVFQHDGTTMTANGSNASTANADGEPEMRYAMPSQPAVFDVDGNGYADVIYIGDLGGNVWKWVIHEPGQDYINGSDGDYHQARWDFRKVLHAWNCSDLATTGPAVLNTDTTTHLDDCTVPHYKSFFFPPTGAMYNSKLWLALGSGERANLDASQDGVTKRAERNRYYVFQDNDPLELVPSTRSLPNKDWTANQADTDSADANPDLDQTDWGDFIDATTITAEAATNSNTCRGVDNIGYFLDGDPGEKFITPSVIFFGMLFTGSYIPAASTAASCLAAGSAYLYGLNLLCGDGIFDVDEDGAMERRLGIGSGLPNAPRASVGPIDDDKCEGEDCDCMVTITSEGEAMNYSGPFSPSADIYLRSWRER